MGLGYPRRCAPLLGMVRGQMKGDRPRMLFNLGAHQTPLRWCGVCTRVCAARGCNSAGSVKAQLLAWHSPCAPALPPGEVVGSGRLEEALLNQVCFWMCFLGAYGDVATPRADCRPAGFAPS